MKISKLFHWLYAFLMLLPILSIPVFMIYSHRHSVADNVPTLETTYKYQTNEVNTTDDLILGNVYHLDYAEIYTNDLDFGLNIVSLYDFHILEGDFYVDDLIFGTYNASRNNYVFLSVFEDYLTLSFSNESACIAYSSDFPFDIEFINFDFVVSYGLDSFKSWVSNEGFNVTSSDYKEIESVNVSYTDNVINVFYNEYENALDTTLSITGNVGLSINNAYSYLVTNLFGISNSGLGLIIVKLLTFWTIISIVYLIFDILMFLPLLAHKWIDKARME